MIQNAFILLLTKKNFPFDNNDDRGELLSTERWLLIVHFPFLPFPKWKIGKYGIKLNNRALFIVECHMPKWQKLNRERINNSYYELKSIERKNFLIIYFSLRSVIGDQQNFISESIFRWTFELFGQLWKRIHCLLMVDPMPIGVRKCNKYIDKDNSNTNNKNWIKKAKPEQREPTTQ